MSLPGLNHQCVVHLRDGRPLIENIDRGPDARPLSSPAEHRTAPPRRGDRMDDPRQGPDAAI